MSTSRRGSQVKAFCDRLTAAAGTGGVKWTPGKSKDDVAEELYSRGLRLTHEYRLGKKFFFAMPLALPGAKGES